MDIFLVTGFSRTIFKEELLLLLLLLMLADEGTKAEVENPEAHPITSATTVVDKNFIFLYGRGIERICKNITRLAFDKLMPFVLSLVKGGCRGVVSA